MAQIENVCFDVSISWAHIKLYDMSTIWVFAYKEIS